MFVGVFVPARLLVDQARKRFYQGAVVKDLTFCVAGNRDLAV